LDGDCTHTSIHRILHEGHVLPAAQHPAPPSSNMSGPPAQALATHLINQTLSSLSVLETLNIISRDDASQIRSRLPNPYGPFPSLEPSLHSSFSQLSVTPASPPRQQMSPQPPTPQTHLQQNLSLVPSLPPRVAPREVRARALWDYSGTVSRDKGSILIQRSLMIYDFKPMIRSSSTKKVSRDPRYS
jgi:hypothetical protein